jgi:hypothetical protein
MGTRVSGRGGAPRRGLYAPPPNGRIQRCGGAASTVGAWGGQGRVWGWLGGLLLGRADLVPEVGQPSCRPLSGHASGRPDVPRLRPKH